MKALIDFKNEIFIINTDGEIEAMTYDRYLGDHGADETTSPRGVAPRIHVREVEVEKVIGEDEDGDDVTEMVTEWQLWTWGVMGNNPRYLESFETEEEAEVSVLEHFEYNLEKNWDAPTAYDSYEEAHAVRIERGAEAEGVSEEVFLSIEKKRKKVEEKRKEIQEDEHRKHLLKDEEMFKKYENVISKIENENYNQTQDRLSVALSERISGRVFHRIVKNIRK